MKNDHMRRLIFSILLLFIADVAVADCCGTTSNADKNKWQNIGKEKIDINGKIVELDVIKNENAIDFRTGEKIVDFIKRNKDNSINIDSMLFSDGTSYVDEADFSMENVFIHREKWRTGLIVYSITKNHKIVEMFDVGKTNDELYNSDGSLKSEYRAVRGDTAFFDLDYVNSMNDGVDEIQEFERTKAKKNK